MYNLGEPLRRGVLALRAALACSRRAIRSITRVAISWLRGWFRFYPSRKNAYFRLFYYNFLQFLTLGNLWKKMIT
jgi:hypothetical protein